MTAIQSAPKRKTWIKRLLWSLLALTMILLVCLAAGLWWVRSSLPQTEGLVKLKGLTESVTILRGDRGVVTIQAQNDHDAAFALGFAHAQDRIWQMDFLRRTASGRLAEVAGEAVLPTDRFMRVLGLARLAEASFNELSAGTKDSLEAYSRGVNAYLDQHEGAWPLALLALQTEPEPWKPSHSLLWGKLMALQLSGNWRDELRRVKMESRFDHEQLSVLWPGDTPEQQGHLSPEQIDWPQNWKNHATPKLLPHWLETRDASNAWIVGSEKTTTGLPILANDPHLELSAPGFWYLVRIETPNGVLAGASAPSVPFLVAGHNGRIAWGFTTTHADTQDLFIDELVEGDPSLYKTPDGTAPITSQEEVIKVKDKPSVTVKVRQTRHGPVISDVLGRQGRLLPEGKILSLAWPALRSDDRTPDALFDLNKAADLEQAIEALQQFHAPVQNIMVADREGSIGFIAAGRIPLRKNGDGRRPAPGWSGQFDWLGVIPFDELPAARNPPEGYLITANHKIIDDDYPHLITAHWPSNHRARRIEDRLNAAHPHSLDDSQVLQSDAYSLAAESLIAQFQKVEDSEAKLAEFIRRLRDWDKVMDRNRPEPLIFAAWISALNRAIFADELGSDFSDFASPDHRRLLAVLERAPQWCDDVSSENKTESCAEQMTKALIAGLSYLNERFGPDSQEWRWGQAHIVTFPHPIYGRLPILGQHFAYEVESDGGNDTVNKGGYKSSGAPERLFEHVHGAGYRGIYDLSDLDRSRFMIATGQSGNPLSPHYGAFAEDWRDGKMITLGPANAKQGKRLVLDPR